MEHSTAPEVPNERPNERPNEAAPEGQTEDAREANPVLVYYRKKKQRYLEQLRADAPDMKSGTPFDWEDAAGYAQPYDATDDENDDSRS